MDVRARATGRGGARRGPKGPGMVVAELDFAALTPWQRRVVYCALARHAGLDPGQRPFGVLSSGVRRVLYAVPGLVDCLAEARGITTSVVSPPRYAQWAGQHLVVCTVRAQDATGRTETSTGAVRWRLWGPGGGDVAARSVARARGRAVLSLVGLAVLDASDLAELPSCSEVGEKTSPGG